MTVEVDEEELEQGLLGLIMAVVEILKEVIDEQALNLVEKGVLDDEAAEQLGQSLMDLDETIQQIEDEHDLDETASETKKQLDRTVDDVLNTAINPNAWVEEIAEQEQAQGPMIDSTDSQPASALDNSEADRNE